MSTDRRKALFVCRASAQDGMGHLFRSHSLIETAPADIAPYMVINGLTNRHFTPARLMAPERVVNRDEEYVAIADELEPDIVIFDLNNLAEDVFTRLAGNRFTVCLSPLFQHISRVHQFFHRTSYLPPGIEGPQVYAGLEYAIITYNCQPIPDSIYRHNLKEERLSVGISMGGGDAPNKTLQVLKTLSDLPDESIIWVFLGTGYSHSYDQLVEESYRHRQQEVILVKTNHAFWNVLKNCHLVILLGGITSYDVVYAGMPAINLLQTPDHRFLVKELADKNACLDVDIFSDEALKKIPGKLSAVNGNRKLLWEIHRNSRALLDNNGGYRVWQRIREGLNQYHHQT